MIDEHKDKRKYDNFSYHSTKCWLKGNDRVGEWMRTEAGSGDFLAQFKNVFQISSIPF